MPRRVKTIDLSLTWEQNRLRREPLTADSLNRWIRVDFLLMINGMLGTATEARLVKCPESIWKDLWQGASSASASDLCHFLRSNDFELLVSTAYDLDGASYVDLSLHRAPAAPRKPSTKKWSFFGRK